MSVPSEGDIQRLLNDLQSADPVPAWQNFLESYAPVLQQVVHLFETEPDAAADCFLFICKKLAQNDFRRLRAFHPGGPASFATWLRAVARNLCLDWYRSVHGRGGMRVQVLQAIDGDDTPDLAHLSDSQPSPERKAADKEIGLAIRGAVSALPAPERLLLRLRYEEDLTLQQIANLTGLKDAQTVDRRLRHILDGLRGKLAPPSV